MSYSDRFSCRAVRALAAAAAMSAPLSLSANTLLAVNSTELADLSLEALMNIEVFSASKRREPLQRAATAIYVLTAEDIQRSQKRAGSVAPRSRVDSGTQRCPYLGGGREGV